MQAFHLGALALGVLLVGSEPAFADCKPLSLVTSVDLVKTKEDPRPFVPVLLNDQRKLMLVDTGGALTEMAAPQADALGLRRVRGAVEIVGVSGKASDEIVKSSLKMGRLYADNMAFMVSPDNDAISDEQDVAGLFGPDILSNYDLDIDFGSGKLNLLSQDHCEGKVIYWPASAVAVLPFVKRYTKHIQFTVKLDGQSVIAELDTGAFNSTLLSPVAVRDFGVKLGAADTPQIGQLTQNDETGTYVHTFKTLDLGGIAVTNPKIVIIPDMTHSVRRQNGSPEGGSRFVDVREDDPNQSMLIGMDVLRHLHIYIAYGEGKVYVTPATTPPPAAAADGAAASSSATH